MYLSDRQFTRLLNDKVMTHPFSLQHLLTLGARVVVSMKIIETEPPDGI